MYYVIDHENENDMTSFETEEELINKLEKILEDPSYHISQFTIIEGNKIKLKSTLKIERE